MKRFNVTKVAKVTIELLFENVFAQDENHAMQLVRNGEAKSTGVKFIDTEGDVVLNLFATPTSRRIFFRDKYGNYIHVDENKVYIDDAKPDFPLEIYDEKRNMWIENK